ncbi:protein STICHEL-like 2 [Macadamia integrifolia]|uniref:protein STICHEL-like 2 n=1 Tax=Macadamia integrifolia TaxID=60698 RepID=UPI001C4E9239|nr:protein STICHEL-like 2 [Macadamia integrifolia]XP_042503074.1 protein STICHEL-like 2 [Macadamia integrifolia]XP_042503076.1 protein STICHEL-like 2 [Macadamia integrifolia]XP_042503077.1 protein STICHEL-like 2 [Macadamia integrifolia]XP_042503078.1 protein STICHEL-like 2 [Macadamia integrifolia]XP_042503079.1 protein STICHEL-like 2 [Macadamia integrifolia]XP_042503080.1 protein STICHEL-like 2 [Macadamia integrifolia]XP_042503081.1 protein STICHEL-like 2 [Macadamia integrifolia]XP_04250308
MSDGQRHSVDIPLSKALVALKRVRSLRDPSTNSISKLTAFVDNLNWEANSCHGLLNSCHVGGLKNHSFHESQNFRLDGRRVDFDSDPELGFSSRRSSCKSVLSKKSTNVRMRSPEIARLRNVDEREHSKSKCDVIHGNKSSSERHFSNHRDKALELACVPTSSDHIGHVDSYGEPTIGSACSERIDATVKRKSGYGARTKSSLAEANFVRSCVSSPNPSVSDGRMEDSSRSTSLFASEEVDHYHDGCGIRCCWSRTPRLRESKLSSDFEDYPLLLREDEEINLSGQGQSCTYRKRKLAHYSGSPSNFCQKFRPISFNDLVGQHAVASSLLNAILKGRITSFYLFHGPRGTGKTSTSKIFAAALNCLSLEEHRPCGSCRECLLFFSGRSRVVKEVDPMRTNRTDRVRSLLKNAVLPPVSSRFKVFIIDECQLLRGETWATILNSLEDLPRHVVFVMITADLDKLPRSAVSRCQRYHFPKIKEADIVNMLTKICAEEDLDFDKVALDFVATKANGSLRDAEMMLDQLSLLGKRITISLAYELIGIVSDDELLDLLDFALSSDTSNTVRRARDLMKSRVDPMQLISQLANLIMDILAGRCQAGSSEYKGSFFGRHTSEANLQKLRHALKVLSETEKQLRSSKNQTTWLTVALLQLSSVESSSLDTNDSTVCLRTASERDDGSGTISSTREILKHPVSCLCDENKSHNSEMHGDFREKLETIWSRVIESCHSNTLKSFLQKEGRLASVFIKQGLAIAEVEFYHPDHVSRAENSLKMIASSLQHVLGCNVEIKINLVPCNATKTAKVKKQSFCLLSFSRGMQDKSCSTSEDGVNQLYDSNFISGKVRKGEKSIETCSDSQSQYSVICSHIKEAPNTSRNKEVISQSTEILSLHRSVQNDTQKVSHLGVGLCGEEGNNCESRVVAVEEPENQPSCFSKTLKFHKRLCSSSSLHTICLEIQQGNKLELSIPRKAYFCSSDPYLLCSNSNAYSYNSEDEDEDGQRKESRVSSRIHCWRNPKFPFRKAWKLRQQHQSSQLMGSVLPCVSAQ